MYCWVLQFPFADEPTDWLVLTSLFSPVRWCRTEEILDFNKALLWKNPQLKCTHSKVVQGHVSCFWCHCRERWCFWCRVTSDTKWPVREGGGQVNRGYSLPSAGVELRLVLMHGAETKQLINISLVWWEPNSLTTLNPFSEVQKVGGCLTCIVHTGDARLFLLR